MSRALLSLALAIALAPNVSAAQKRDRTGTINVGDGVELFYRVIGTGRDTIVALHGGPGLDLGYMVPDLERLGRSRTVIFYDQRGTGQSTVVSDSARVNLAAHIADLESVRRHFHLGRMVLFGHSWGAALAARYALVHGANVGKLILVDAMPPRVIPYGPQAARNLRAWMDSATQVRLGELARARRGANDAQAACRDYWRLFIRGYFSNPMDTVAIGRMRGSVCTAPPAAIQNSPIVNALTLGPLGDWDWRKDFGGLHAPVLVIHGSKDPIPVESAREWAAIIPGAKLAVIEGAGHFSYIEQPTAFYRAVDAFLK